MDIFHIANFTPELELTIRLGAETTFIHGPAEAASISRCGFVYNAVAQAARPTDDDAFEHHLSGSPLKYIHMNMHAVQLTKQRIKQSGLTPAAKRVCGDRPMQFALFLDSPVWHQQVNDALREQLLREFDYIGLYPDIAHLSLFVPVHMPRMQTKDPTLWLRRICATLLTPFAITLNADADSLPCAPTWSDIFAPMEHSDVASIAAPWPYGGSCNNRNSPAPPVHHSAHPWPSFPESNLGTIMLNMSALSVQKTLVLYLDAYVREITDYVRLSKQSGKLGYCIHGDQTAWREAVYMMMDELKTARFKGVCRPKKKHDTTGCLIYHKSDAFDRCAVANIPS
eukprot:TRINITY_DN12321_c1_g1_i1.p1 TRINITY_DN12321_c1_g1~~TRINITY_DN12321_c1_g1_i1.p1  ORF type:complete len:385 (+),score=35.32 TRINITY_DN12321_c1_g1_i1:136-1155(+)